MRAFPLAFVAVIFLASCAQESRKSPPVIVVHTPPTVQVETKRVVVVERDSEPEAVSKALLSSYAAEKPAVNKAILASHKPAVIDKLAALDMRVRAALRPFLRRRPYATEANVDAAIGSLSDLKSALAVTAQSK